MATIEKREGEEGAVSYRVRIRLKGKPAQTATFARITDAKIWAQDTEAAVRKGKYFKTAEAQKRTFGELLDKYEKEVLSYKQGIENQKHYLAYWRAEFGEYFLADVTAPRISETRNKLIGSKNRYGREIGVSTANRYTTALGHVFTVAINQFEWLEANPIAKVQKLKEPRGRVRYLLDWEREVLLAECKKSQNKYLHAVVVAALSTGARKAEILTLKWEDVNLELGQVVFHETKNGERRSSPLRGFANELFREIYIERGNNIYVFQSETTGRPIDIRTAWEVAVKNSRITNFRFHDLRHSAASYLAMNGASIAEIAEVLGHKTLQMVKRYAHLSEAHTSGVVEKMNKRIFG
jgi:integrase